MAQRYKKRKDGLYSTRVTLGRKADGAPIIKTIYARTQPELKSKAELLKNNGVVASNNFGAIANEWRTQKEPTVKYNTMKSYKSNMDKLEPLFGKSMEDITAYDVQNIINALHAKGYSKSILQKVRKIYGMIADYAITKNIKVANYMKQIVVPANAKIVKRRALTDEEIATVNQHVDKPLGLYAYMLLYTGLRRGEILALQWKDINLKAKTISVYKSVEHINNKPQLTTTKSKKSRIVPILDRLLPYLQEQPENKELYIFSGDRLMSNNMIKKRWDKYIEIINSSRAESEKFRITQHQLRHTYTTMLYKSGIDVKTAQKFVGHSDVRTTLEIYTHLENEKISQTDYDKINEFISSS